jgi:2-phosphosulfolactate phosphatase
MNIDILHLIDGVRKATGLTVIIDVFRAFSTACYAFAQGATRIIPVGDLDLAYELKEKNPEFLLLGNRGR